MIVIDKTHIESLKHSFVWYGRIHKARPSMAGYVISGMSDSAGPW